MSNTIKLGEVIVEYSVKNKTNAEYPVYSVTNSAGFCKDYFGKEVASKNKTTYKIVPYGYFAYNPSRINVGSIDWQHCEANVIVSPLYNVFGVTDKIKQDYLLYYLKSSTVNHYINAKAKGAVRLNLPLSTLMEFEIPVPPLAEQERIVEELDLLSGIIEKQKQQLKELDTLAQSIFYDTFGDPITNEKNWPLFVIKDIIKFQGGSQPNKQFFEYEKTPDNIRLIQIRDYKTSKYITYIPKNMAKRFCTKDDIMIGRYGPPIFQVLGGIEGSFNVALMKAIPLKGNRTFIRAFLKQDCLLHFLESHSKRTAGQDGIQMDKLLNYPFPFPPLSLQEEFAEKIEMIEKQKEAIGKSIKETQLLFDYTMDKYFG